MRDSRRICIAVFFGKIFSGLNQRCRTIRRLIGDLDRVLAIFQLACGWLLSHFSLILIFNLLCNCVGSLIRLQHSIFALDRCLQLLSLLIFYRTRQNSNPSNLLLHALTHRRIHPVWNPIWYLRTFFPFAVRHRWVPLTSMIRLLLLIVDSLLWSSMLSPTPVNTGGFIVSCLVRLPWINATPHCKRPRARLESVWRIRNRLFIVDDGPVLLQYKFSTLTISWKTRSVRKFAGISNISFHYRVIWARFGLGLHFKLSFREMFFSDVKCFLI